MTEPTNAALDIFQRRLEKLTASMISADATVAALDVNLGKLNLRMPTVGPMPSPPPPSSAPGGATASPTSSMLGVITQALAPILAQLQRQTALLTKGRTSAPGGASGVAPASAIASIVSPAKLQQSPNPTPTASPNTAAGTQGGGAMGGIMSGVAALAKGPISILAGAASAVTGVIGAVVQGFGQLVSAMGGAVAALNPSAMLQFNAAMRDLSAVVGVAVQPLFNMLTDVARELGAALLPVMKKLEPVMRSLAGTVMEVAKVWINTVASVLTTFIPVVKFLAGIFNAFAPVLQTVYALFSALVEAVAGIVRGLLGWLGIDVTDMTKSLRSAMESLAKTTLLAVAALSTWLNKDLGNNVIKGIRNALGIGNLEKQRAEGLGAVQNPNVGGSLQDFGRNVTRSALLAGPGGEKEKKSEEWLKDIDAQLKLIEKGQGSGLEKAVAEIKATLFAAAARAALDIATFGVSAYIRNLNAGVPTGSSGGGGDPTRFNQTFGTL